ncbi:cytochrome P450 [Mycolicibacterium arenosum]|uniref:Cytochrome P450 n=1 Tax=Mycolicibacterium arenosum TaxID=2952157 RepID=A0ABT1M4E1_9MYCO|nr:cytochrome P450 [Mycolicibacterium sp. CAU 1645]MCP9274024.1 cytochrome P450 [Mycolicibacterium sp. CAU 1645]
MQLPLANCPGTSLPQHHVDLFRSRPTLDITLADGTAAIAVTRQRDVRTVLSDNRFSRERFHMPIVGAGGEVPLALVTSDPPTHTRRRQAVRGWFTKRRAENARPLIGRLAEQLVDDLIAAGPPADILTRFCQPFPNLVHMALLGLDSADLPYLLPRLTVAWSVGHHPLDEVTKANRDLHDYLESRVDRARSRTTAGGLIDALVQDESSNGLTHAEIVMLAKGLLLSGAETTASHLALSLIELLQHPGLVDSLRRSPEQIPCAVEELLRWVWFGGTIAGTTGCPHVATADVTLRDRLIAQGEIVVPVIDVANRDRDVFADADGFYPRRSPNPHLTFGYGRHQCVGMAFARLELQVGLHTVLTRLGGLTLMTASEIDWCTQMFTRGVSSLPVTWRGGGQ